jgi:hypothetical protein
MAEKSRESLSDALNSYLADQAGRASPGSSRPDVPRQAASNNELNAAYQAILETYRPARPVEASAGSAEPAAPAPAAAPPTGKEQLVQAYDRLIEHEATKPKSFLPPLPAKWRRFVVPAVAAASIATTAYIWIAKPAWLFPDSIRSPRPARRSEPSSSWSRP